jgi:hypothetical protein
MKTSRSQKDPLFPGELIPLLIIIGIGLLADFALNPIVEMLNYFKNK